MPTVSLFNLYLGSELPPQDYTSAKIGPFTVRLVPEYKERVQLLPHYAYKRTGYDFAEGVLTKQVSFVDKRSGGWAVTAEAEFDAGSTTSVLCRGQNNDHGVWDLCELLTFITGRRVAMEDQLERYSP
jgi:hypothetical protein